MKAVPDSSADDPRIETVLGFWFGGDATDPAAVEASWKRWFGGGDATDRDIRTRFADLTEAARREELTAWRETSRGRLALIILLDQFGRNVHRGTAAAFATDGEALALTLDGIDAGLDRALAPLERVFFYMPLQHAESREVQRRSVDVFAALAEAAAPAHVGELLRSSAEYARQHRDIIERFGRFPHRNAVLGRTSTAAEREYLDAGAPSFGQ